MIAKTYGTMLWCEKVFAPFMISYFFAYLSNLNVSDHPTNLNIKKDNTSKRKMQFLNKGVYY